MKFTKRRFRTVEYLLLGAILLLLLLRLGLLVARSVHTIPFPFQLDPTEGIVLSECAMLGRGVNIYARFTAERFISAPYPPAYYVITALLMRFSGVNLAAGRLVSFLSTLATAGAIFWALGPRKKRWAVPLLAGLLWLGMAPTFVWAARLKPDLLAVAGSLAGVAWAWRYWGQRRMFWAVLPLTVAVWSKQSALAGVVAVGLALLLEEARPHTARWRQALHFGLLYGAVAGLPLLVVDLFIDHGLWEHLVSFHVLPWSAGRFLGHLWDVVSVHPVLFAAGLGLFALELWRQRRPSLLSLYFVLATLFSFSGGTFGGFHNHYLEALAAACLLTGAALQQIQPDRGRIVALGLVLLQVASFWWVPGWLHYEFYSPVFEQAERLEGLARYVRDHGGAGREFYSDNIALLVVNGQDVRFNDPLIMAQAAVQGLWDESEFLHTIEEGDFVAILWRDDLAGMEQRSNDLSPAAFEAIQKRYEILYRDVENVYVPRQPMLTVPISPTKPPSNLYAPQEPLPENFPTVVFATQESPQPARLWTLDYEQGMLQEKLFIDTSPAVLETQLPPESSHIGSLWVYKLSSSPDGRYVAVTWQTWEGSGVKTTIISLDGNLYLPTIPDIGISDFLAWIPGSERFVVGSLHRASGGTINFDGTEFVQFPARYVRDAVVSSNGKTIIFSATPKDGVWLRSIGVDVQNLTSFPSLEDSNHVTNLALSPDGQLLAFTSDPKSSASPLTRQVWVVDTDGSNQRPLSPDNTHNTNLAWAPDSRTIAFIRRENLDTQIPSSDPTLLISSLWLVNVETGEEQLLLSSEKQYAQWSPRWLPDGSGLIFLSDRGGESNLWFIRPDGTGLQQLTQQGNLVGEISLRN